MIDQTLVQMYHLPQGTYAKGGPQPPPGTNPQPGLPPSGSPFYQWPNPLQGAEDWLLGAAAGFMMPFLLPVILIFVVLIIGAAVFAGGTGLTLGLFMGDNT